MSQDRLNYVPLTDLVLTQTGPSLRAVLLLQLLNEGITGMNTVLWLEFF